MPYPDPQVDHALRPAGQAASTTSAVRLAEIVVKIVEALQPLAKADQVRIIRSAAAFYGIENEV